MVEAHSPVASKIGTTDTSFKIAGLEEGTYTAEVRAINTKYDSWWSYGTATFSIVENKESFSVLDLKTDYTDATHIALQFCIQNYIDENTSVSVITSEYAENGAEYKTDVVSTAFQSYIYWHWTWNNAWRSGDNYNVFVAAKSGWDEESQRTHNYFSAFESAAAYGYTDPNGTSGLDPQGRKDLDCCYAWFGNAADGSWWWFSFPVYEQTYADFVKEYTFQRVTENIETKTEVQSGNGISNIQHWVKYRH